MNDLMNLINNIIVKKEPNKIISYYSNLPDNKYDYTNLLKFWKDCSGNDENNETYQEYIKIKNFNLLDNNVGIVSLFYFKNQEKFLAIGKYKNELFHLGINCPEYKKVLENAITDDSELYVLTYWIM